MYYISIQKHYIYHSFVNVHTLVSQRECFQLYFCSKPHVRIVWSASKVFWSKFFARRFLTISLYFSLASYFTVWSLAAFTAAGCWYVHPNRAKPTSCYELLLLPFWFPLFWKLLTESPIPPFFAPFLLLLYHCLHLYNIN